MLQRFVDTVNGWLSDRLEQNARAAVAPARLDRLAAAWETVNRAAREADTYNLDRRPLVFSVFGTLAEAVR